jgi:drug/metabolite transporter (DMT)-like permease
MTSRQHTRKGRLSALRSVRSHAARHRVGIALALGSALAFASMGTLVKVGYRRGVSTSDLLAARFLVGAIVWALILAPRFRHIEWRRRATAWAVASGLGGGLAGYAEFAAYRRLSVALVVLLLFASPIWIAVAERTLHGVHLRAWSLVALALILGGLVIFTGLSPKRTDWVGVTLALVASLGGAILFFGMYEATQLHGAAVTTGIVIWSAAIVTTLVAVGGGGLDTVTNTASNIGLSIVLGVVTSVVGVGLLAGGIHRIGPLNTALVATAEPVFAAGIAWATLGETITGVQSLGGTLMILGILVIERSLRRASWGEGASPSPWASSEGRDERMIPPVLRSNDPPREVPPLPEGR